VAVKGRASLFSELTVNPHSEVTVMKPADSIFPKLGDPVVCVDQSGEILKQGAVVKNIQCFDLDDGWFFVVTSRGPMLISKLPGDKTTWYQTY
jgi:hypothetical protein